MIAKMKHGGLQQLDLGDKSAYLDLSVNLNPYGPQLNSSLTMDELANYPDPQGLELCRVIAKERGCAVEQILLGNGASELIWAAARAFVEAGESVVAIKPSFSEFQTAAIQVEAKLLEFESFESDDFRIDLEQLDQYLTQFKPKIFSLCNPNSPTGGYLGPEAISGLATRHPYTLILLDESFLSLSIHHQAQDAKYPANVVRIVSLTKDYAIAGIRLGYALGSPELLNKMKAEIPSWSVNALAQKIGITLFDDKNFLDRSRHSIFRDKVLVEASFRERSVRYIPGTTVFCMFKHPYKDLSQALLDDHKILIRSCDSYGLSQWYRIAIRPEIEMQRFFKALDSVNEGLEERR